MLMHRETPLTGAGNVVAAMGTGEWRD